MASGEEETTWGDVEVGRPHVHSARSVPSLKRDEKSHRILLITFIKKLYHPYFFLHQGQIKEEK